MKIFVEMKPAVLAELSRRATADGIDISTYAAGVLEKAARLPDGSKLLSQSQLDNTLRELAQFSDKIPLLPDEAFWR